MFYSIKRNLLPFVCLEQGQHGTSSVLFIAFYIVKVEL